MTLNTIFIIMAVLFFAILVINGKPSKRRATKRIGDIRRPNLMEVTKIEA